ncbi:hypothetical protein [Roseovarius sp. 2305UL8-3]|uniref:hypothetical protein n=1 Tax=Roseovarius conchicola TaxID=3121636 RepID=UPI0035270AF7
MTSDDLLALHELQDMPVILDPVGQAFVRKLTTWSDAGERVEHRRHRHEAIAHSGMSLEELHLFFARAGLIAAQSWNAHRTIWGKLRNFLTASHIGFAQVPGRILKQAMERMGEGTGDTVIPTANYLMRADVALEFRDRFAALRSENA